LATGHPALHDVTALILCGGLGTRLRPAVEGIPKVLAPVARRPFIDYQLAFLKSQGIIDFVLCTGYGAAHVEEYCGSGTRWDIRLRYSRESEPLGTGGAVKNAQGLPRSNPFLVLNGDCFVAVDLGHLVALHSERQSLVTLALVEVADKSAFGAVTLAEDWTVRAFNEKGASGPGLINAGVYVLSEAVLEMIPAGRCISLERDVFPQAAKANSVVGLPFSVPFLDIGTVESYAQAPQFLAQWPAGEA
jgi:NDP-sugar pyrophosphorylase family protein